MKFLAGEWLRSAESDIETIDEIIDNPHLTHVVAFHSHQCIENGKPAIGDAKEFHRFAVDIHDKIKDFLESK